MERGGSGTKDTGVLLQELLQEFPYFQTAQLLLAAGLHEQQHIRSDRQVKIASAYAGDRKVLYTLLHRQGKGSTSLFSREDSPFVLDKPAPDVHQVVAGESVFAEASVPENPFVESAYPSSSEAPAHYLPEGARSAEESLPSEEAHSIPEFSLSDSFRETEPEEIPFAEASPVEVHIDPREVIKKRLAEILGVPEEKTSQHEVAPAIENVQPPSPALPSSNVAGAPESEPLSTPESSEESAIVHPPVSEITTPIRSAEEIILEEVSHERGTELDSIQKTELEHALEETLLHSLEKLPLIHKEEIATNLTPEPVPADLSPRSFLEWLKSRNTDTFGTVEEVHAEHEEGHAEAVRTNSKEPEVSPAQEIQANSRYEGSPAGVSSNDLIDRFIATEPRIVPSKAEFYSPANQAKKSVFEYEDIVSETLAKIYLQQGNLLKARSGFEKLSLLHPEKSAYFAALVKEIDEQLNNTNKEDF